MPTFGVLFEKNVVSSPGAGTIGIVLDARFDNNLIIKNHWAENTGASMPYSDDGTGNCAKQNYSDPGSFPFFDFCP